jgi:signal transduction histidine kinase
VTLDLNEGEVRVAAFVDPAQLQQAVANIMVNAIHATAPGGRVSVTLSAEPEPSIVVSDTGSGIPPEHLPQIFEPFFTTKAAGVGTGLGLSVTAGIIQEHGGTIDVESVLGQGTTFRISLAASNHAPSQSPPPSDFAARDTPIAT